MDVELNCVEELPHPQQYYRTIFNKYDRDSDGYLSVTELVTLIESREYDHDIPHHVIKQIYKRADQDHNGKLDFSEYVKMVNEPVNKPVFGYLMHRYICMLVPKRRSPPTTTVTDGLYEEEYSCYPPAIGMIILSLFIILFFCIDEAIEGQSTLNKITGPVGDLFIYDPYKREEIWRFFTYMFVHIGFFHLFVNLMVQIMLGIPLEMVHKWWRVLIIYVAGVIAGSLGTSVTDPTVKLAGASGGVYSLITAHISTIIMNWSEMSFPAVQLLIFLIITVSDVGTAIYHRYVLNIDEHIGYTAHFAGALAGLLVGFNILRNLKVTRTERVIWWISLVLFFSLIAVAIVLNVVWGHYQPPKRQYFN